MSLETTQKLIVVLCLILFVACEEDTPIEYGNGQLPSQTWTFSGLENHYIQKVEIAGNWVYAASRSGIFKKELGSEDTLWIEAGLSGMEITDMAILGEEHLLASLVLDAENPSNVLYESHDGGENWNSLQSDFGGTQGAVSCHALGVSPDNPNLIYARGAYNVAKSIDGGKSWRSVFADWDNIGYQSDLITVSEENPDLVWAGGESSIFAPYLVKSEDAGETWETLDVPSEGDNAVYSMVISPENTQRLLVGMEGRIISSEDGGASWEVTLSPENYSYFYDMQTSLVEDSKVYASGTDGGNSLGEILIYTTTDFGQNWSTAQYAGQEGKEYLTLDLTLFSEGSQEAMYVATNHGVFIYRP